MKKLILCLFVSFCIIGCGTKMGNTPTKKVESFINKYQTLDISVLEDLDSVISKENFNDEHKDKYRDIVKKNYQKMSYKIKDEVINGDAAVVTVEITVIDYSKINNETDLYLLNNPNEFKNANGDYDSNLYNDYRIKKLEEIDETVTYTLELELTKENDEWVLNDLDDMELSKINGTYNY